MDAHNAMDEIIFRERNKAYGAYQLRRRYPRILAFSLLMAVILFVATALAYFYSTRAIHRKQEAIYEYLPIGVNGLLGKPPDKLPAASGGYFKSQKIPQVVDSVSFADTLFNMAEGQGTDTTGSGTGSGSGDGTGNIFLAVQQAPSFPGGDDARTRYLQQNIRYPARAREKNIQGTVYISFVVEKDGRISMVKLLKGIGYGCDEEALRVVQAMPRWNPGRQHGQTVRVQIVLPLHFLNTTNTN